MYIEENGWMLELIFDLSSQALIRMVNQLFHTAYSDKEKLWQARIKNLQSSMRY